MTSLLRYTLLAVLASGFLGAAPAIANIYMDENFEDASPFTNHSWAVKDNVQLPTATSIAATQGVNIRADRPDAAGAQVSVDNSGTISSAAAFSGAQSLHLASGQHIAINGNGAYVWANLKWFKVVQFAVAVDAAALAQPVGAVVGRFQQNWSTDSGNTLSTVEVVYTLNLVRNAAGGVDIVIQNTGMKVGELAGAGQWTTVTVIASTQTAGPENWEAWDPLTSSYKGPKPVGDPLNDAGAYAGIDDGITVWIGADAPGHRISAADLGSGWASPSDSTYLLNWTIAAENGGGLHVDELFWCHGLCQSNAAGNPISQDAAARMNPFGEPAKLRLHGLFVNNMVLQRDRSVPVWGWAQPGSTVDVDFNGQRKSAVASSHGAWKVHLDPMPAGGPFTMTVADGVTTRRVDNVLVGEVWFCSGQSNMVMKVSESDNAAAETSAATWPRIRVFTLPWSPSNRVESDVSGSWAVCDPSTAGEFSAAAYYFGRSLHQSLPPGDVPIGLIVSAVGATRAEDWMSSETLAADPETAPLIGSAGYFGVVAVTLYNGMVAPVIPYGIRGAIWYQGESNANNPTLYRKLFPNLISSWRAAWNRADSLADPEFPFLFVQLPNFITRDDWPSLREAQFLTLALPRTAMAVAIESGDPNDIHPKHKQVVGERLALAARARVYGEPIAWTGPLYRRAAVEGDKIRVEFYPPGIELRDRNDGALEGFTVAGADKVFVAATAVIDGGTVMVSSTSVPQPRYVRYLWENNPPAADLVGTTGLPASPFRTDGPPPPDFSSDGTAWGIR